MVKRAESRSAAAKRGKTPAARARKGRRAPRKDAGRNAVLERATDVLTALARLPQLASLNAVSKEAGLSKATAFRILTTLSEQGFVDQDPTTSSYRLGIAPLRLATAVLEGIPLHAVARPVMRAVSDLLNETVVLCVRDGDTRVNIDAVVCTNAIGSSRRIGEPRPLHSGAASRVMLATLSDDEIEAYVRRHRLGKEHGGNPAYLAQMWKDVRTARRTGWAAMIAEVSGESYAVATAIRSSGADTVAALYIAIPKARLTPSVEARCAQALLRAAAEIERELKAGTGG